ncbi:hypothetical protein D3C87_1724670 [compost metagenome]
MPWAWPAPSNPGIIELKLSAATPAIARLTSAPASRAGRACAKWPMISMRLSLACIFGRPLAFFASWSRRVASSSAATIFLPRGDWKNVSAGLGSARFLRNCASARWSTARAEKR